MSHHSDKIYYQVEYARVNMSAYLIIVLIMFVRGMLVERHALHIHNVIVAWHVYLKNLFHFKQHATLKEN